MNHFLTRHVMSDILKLHQKASPNNVQNTSSVFLSSAPPGPSLLNQTSSRSSASQKIGHEYWRSVSFLLGVGE